MIGFPSSVRPEPGNTIYFPSPFALSLSKGVPCVSFADLFHKENSEYQQMIRCIFHITKKENIMKIDWAYLRKG